MGRLFDGAMQEYSASRVAAVVDAYDFSEFATIDDVGGGRGSLVAGILKASTDHDHRRPRRQSVVEGIGSYTN